VAVAALIGTQTVHAGPACCPASKAKAAEEAKAALGSCEEKCLETSFKGIEMTEDQETKIADLLKKCNGQKCSVLSAKAMKKGLEEILTKDQIKTLKASCEEETCFLKKLGEEVDS
jgi:Spy/CpxP family protein refolding chaperone